MQQLAYQKLEAEKLDEPQTSFDSPRSRTSLIKEKTMTIKDQDLSKIQPCKRCKGKIVHKTNEPLTQQNNPCCLANCS